MRLSSCGSDLREGSGSRGGGGGGGSGCGGLTAGGLGVLKGGLGGFDAQEKVVRAEMCGVSQPKGAAEPPDRRVRGGGWAPST